MAKKTSRHRKIVVLLLAVLLSAWGGWQFYGQLNEKEKLPERYMPQSTDKPVAAVPKMNEPRTVLLPQAELQQATGKGLHLASLSGHNTIVFFVDGECAEKCLSTLLKLTKLEADWGGELVVLVVQYSEKHDAWQRQVASYSKDFIAVVADAVALAEWRAALADAEAPAELYVLNKNAQVVGELAIEKSVAYWVGKMQRWFN